MVKISSCYLVAFKSYEREKKSLEPARCCSSSEVPMLLVVQKFFLQTDTQTENLITVTLHSAYVDNLNLSYNQYKKIMQYV